MRPEITPSWFADAPLPQAVPFPVLLATTAFVFRIDDDGFTWERRPRGGRERTAP